MERLSVLRNVVPFHVDIGFKLQIRAFGEDGTGKDFHKRLPFFMIGQGTAFFALTEHQAVGGTHVNVFDGRGQGAEPLFCTVFVCCQRFRLKCTGICFTFQTLTERIAVEVLGKPLRFPVRIREEGAGTESHKNNVDSGILTFFNDQILKPFPSIIIMDDNGIHVQRFHAADETGKLFRRVTEQTFAGIKAAYFKRFHNYLSISVVIFAMVSR